MCGRRRVHQLLAGFAILGIAGSLGIPSRAAREIPGKIAYIALTKGTWQVWVAAADGRRARLVTRSIGDKAHCSWYPDGRRLLVDRLDAPPIRVDVATGRETPIALPFPNVADAVVSPNGREIAFSATTAGAIDGNEIWVAKADGSALRRLTEMPALQHEPAWTPDGRWLYFLSGKGGQAHDIWRVAVDGKSREQITAGTRYHFEVAVSPTGELAYSSNRSGNYEIWTKRGDHPAVQVTHNPALDGEPAWSPDGRSILFTSTRGGVPNLWRVVLGDGPPVQVTHTRGGARAAAWWHPPHRANR